MKIAFLLTSFPEASHTFIVNQIAGLLDRGHEVEVFTNAPCRRQTAHEDVQRYGLLARTHVPAVPARPALRMLAIPPMLLRHGWRAPAALLRAFDVRRYGMMAWSGATFFGALPFLSRRRVDIIHAHFGPNGIRAAHLLDTGLLHGRLIVSFHGYDVNVFPRRYGRQVYRRLFEVGDAYTANTAFTRGRAIGLGCPRDRIGILPVGIRLDRYVFRERQVEPGGPVSLLSVGNLVEVKGIEYGLRAVARLAERYPRLRYTIVGDGPLRIGLEGLARQLGIAGRVTFAGAQPDEAVREFYRDAHVFLLPGVVGADGAEEGQGLVLVEAQACGLPIVASRVGGIPETVREGHSAVLTPPRDVEALAAELNRLLEDPPRWPAMGRAGREFVERRYDIGKLNEELETLYRRVLAGSEVRGRPDP